MTNKQRLIIIFFCLSLLSLPFFNIHAVKSIESINITIPVLTPPILKTDIYNRVSSTYPFSLIDGYNRNVTFTEEPQRIISIAPSVTEVIYAVGAGEKLIAVDFSSNYPNETESLPKIANYPTLDI